MRETRQIRSAWAFAALLGALLAFNARADEIVLDDGKTITGQISYEDDDMIKVQTPSYGDLTFKKFRVKSITRSSGSAAPVSSAPGAQPGAAANTGGSTSGPNPFAPDQSTGGRQPGFPPLPPPGAWGSLSPSSAPTPGPGELVPDAGVLPMPSSGSASSAAPALALGYKREDFTAPSTITDPAVPPGADGVLFGVDKKNPVLVKKNPQSQQLDEAQDMATIMAGWECRTQDGRARIKLRSGDSLRFEPRTQCGLSAISIDAAQINLQVKNGGLWMQVAERPKLPNIKIEAPDFYLIVKSLPAIVKVSVQTGRGSRAAVFLGSVEVVSIKTRERKVLEEGNAAIVNPQGQISPAKSVFQMETDEWRTWDVWTAEQFKQLQVFPSSSLLAPSAAGNEPSNPQGASSALFPVNYQKTLRIYSEAFMKFARDTGQVPDDQNEGWEALRVNKGNWDGWKGPYLNEDNLPPLDPWRRPVHYSVRYSDKGNVHGIVYSEGIDQRDNQGKAGTDDICAYVMYYQIPKIAERYNRKSPGTN